jgi:hypothetical protein
MIVRSAAVGPVARKRVPTILGTSALAEIVPRPRAIDLVATPQDSPRRAIGII